MIAGDHLLPRITPAVGLYPESRPDPLGDYVDLARTRGRAGTAPGAAGPRRADRRPGGARPRDRRHHRDRLDEAVAALGADPRTGYELSYALFPDDRGPSQRRFAVAETLSHLERLVVEGRAARSE